MTFRKKTTREILNINLKREAPDGMKNLKVLLHNIRSMHNVGSAFRSCDAFGAGELLLSGYTPVPPRPEITKTALGAEESVPWSNPPDIITYLKKKQDEGSRIIGVEQTHESRPLPGFNPSPEQNLILVFGNEVTGIDDELLPLLDLCLEIPQFGQKHSLNISVSLGVVLYHIADRFSR